MNQFDQLYLRLLRAYASLWLAGRVHLAHRVYKKWHAWARGYPSYHRVFRL